MSNNNLINFTIGIEIIEGFNRGMRDYQIDLMGPYIDNKFDVYLGLRAGWFFQFLERILTNFTTIKMGLFHYQIAIALLSIYLKTSSLFR